MQSHKRRGFTLIEVIVALGIAGGALILLLSANQASLQRSMRSREACIVEQLVQSKLDEVCYESESASSGRFEGFPSWSWHVSINPEPLGELKTVKRVVLRARNADSGRECVYSTLLFRPGKDRTAK